MIRTSLNIPEKLYEHITEKAESKGCSKSAVIKEALYHFSATATSRLIPSDDSVSYQEDGHEWHTFCIQFSENEYECFTDLRKIWKLSLSFILSIAFIQFVVDSATEESNSDGMIHSYIINHYKIHKESPQNGITITINWRITPAPQLE